VKAAQNGSVPREPAGHSAMTIVEAKTAKTLALAG
jgi:hypothetical protein